MSEKLYGCLLYLYPATFREAHGDDALQLFRDRLREETGLYRRVQFWFDIVLDLLISLPRLHMQPQPAFAAAHSSGSPMFLSLEDESIRPAALVSAGVIALVAYSLIAVLAHATHALRGSSPDVADTHARRAHARTGPPKPEASEPTAERPAQLATPAGGTAVYSSVPDPKRQRVLDAVIKNLKQYYFDPAVALKMADALAAHLQHGDDAVATDDAFAALLTAQMRDVSHDMHVQVIYNATPPPQSSPQEFARMLEDLKKDNCSFEKVQMLPHHIGYLKLGAFLDPSDCGPTAAAAMASLNQADALIFDLRENRGGTSEMVSLIASRLFDHPEYMFDPKRVPTLESWTFSPVPGSRLTDKPVYILTSSTTISAAEQFTYDLKMLQRATIVGEVTAGGAHAGVFHRIDAHYAVAIPESRAVNPYGPADWEGVGIAPDVRVPATAAFETALQRAESQIRLQKRP